MLGHLKPRACQLSSDSKNHYQHLYCSLCFSLRQQFGLSASFLINHELTLSLAAISTTQNLTLQQCACPAKLYCGEKTIVCDAVIDKAARLCVLLVWLKLVDSQIDNPALYKKGLQLVLNTTVQGILKELSLDTQQFISQYLILVQDNNDFTTTAKMSGLLAKKLFQELNSDDSVSEITLLLGELITIADALLDLNSDIEQKQYNPIIESTKKNQTQLKKEYVLLLNNYLTLAEKIKQKLNNDINPLFKELLTQSLKNLTARIYRVNNALFADNTNDTQRRRRNSADNSVSDGCFCLDCCNCCDCCQCCGECGSNAEGASGCCDCCACDCSC